MFVWEVMISGIGLGFRVQSVVVWEIMLSGLGLSLGLVFASSENGRPMQTKNN